MDSASHDEKDTPSEPPAESSTGPPARTSEVAYVDVHELRPDGDDGTCLRPLGLCELGGCCDVCWYRPDHPRFQKKTPDDA